jgi:hypothetical protein
VSDPFEPGATGPSDLPPAPGPTGPDVPPPPPTPPAEQPSFFERIWTWLANLFR